jgi:hypothetical protein
MDQTIENVGGYSQFPAELFFRYRFASIKSLLETINYEEFERFNELLKKFESIVFKLFYFHNAQCSN